MHSVQDQLAFFLTAMDGKIHMFMRERPSGEFNKVEEIRQYFPIMAKINQLNIRILYMHIYHHHNGETLICAGGQSGHLFLGIYNSRQREIAQYTTRIFSPITSVLLFQPRVSKTGKVITLYHGYYQFTVLNSQFWFSAWRWSSTPCSYLRYRASISLQVGIVANMPLSECVTLTACGIALDPFPDTDSWRVVSCHYPGITIASCVRMQLTLTGTDSARSLSVHMDVKSLFTKKVRLGTG